MLKNLDLSDQAEALLIAPCGMNCGICLAYLRKTNKCPGCRIELTLKPKTRTHCKIKNCQFFKDGNFKFCYGCGQYPCKRLKQLDKRYRTKYRMSMIENLDGIKSLGLDKFLQNEQARWRCPECKGVICVHKGFCLNCKAVGNTN
jgi:hypothetical protein